MIHDPELEKLIENVRVKSAAFDDISTLYGNAQDDFKRIHDLVEKLEVAEREAMRVFMDARNALASYIAQSSRK